MRGAGLNVVVIAYTNLESVLIIKNRNAGIREFDCDCKATQLTFSRLIFYKLILGFIGTGNRNSEFVAHYAIFFMSSDCPIAGFRGTSG